METFDYVIVGAGSAGSVLANRLSEDAGTSVCVLEAGPSDWHPYIHLPAGFIKTFHMKSINWGYQQEPGPVDRRAQHLRAARQDARRLVLDQRPHLQPRPAPGFRHLGAARQPRLGLCGRAALFQADGAAHRRGRGHLSRPRRPADRHRHRLAAIRSARPSSRARSASASRATPITTARIQEGVSYAQRTIRTAGASAPRRRSCTRR